MKNILKYLLIGAVSLFTIACENIDTLNEDPNNPAEVPSNMLMSGAEKWIMDNVYDNWFSGRQCLVYSQYWSQRNYTEEDRYQIRESVNNSYFNYLYMGIANLNKVIKMNTDETTKNTSSAYGANANQIAAAKILKVWLMQVITDTWGSVPYSEISQLEEGVIYCKYDDQKELYTKLIEELSEAVNMIDENETAFTSGDIIYGGDASKWKKFGNSLKCRLAIHISKVDTNWKKYIQEALASGVFESNSDCALYKYSTSGSEYCKFYEGWYVDGRNDFTMAKPLMDILKGVKDDLNGKSHPFEGIVDPRLSLYTTSYNGNYKGMPYGAPSSTTAGLRGGTPNWYYYPSVVQKADFSIPLMNYDELLFIVSEYKNFSEEEYKKGIEASITLWMKFNGEGAGVTQENIDSYVSSVVAKGVNAETVALQKYIALYMNGTEAWTEIRRTGYPEQILRPGEITAVLNDNNIIFNPLSEVKGDIIARVKYPTNESSLNGSNWTEAVSKLQDGTNNYYSKMFWDVRKTSYEHPTNK